MKRALIILLMICSLFVFSANCEEVDDSKTVTIYMFRSNDCSECLDAIQFFNDYFIENSHLKNVIDFKSYDITSNDENNSLFISTKDYFKDDVNATPYIVVGNKYHKAGFSDELEQSIIETAFIEYADDNYLDVIELIRSEKNIDASSMSINDVALAENINSTLEYVETVPDFSEDNELPKAEEEEKKNITNEVNDKTMIYIVIATAVVAAVAVTGIIITSKNQKNKKKANKNTL